MSLQASFIQRAITHSSEAPTPSPKPQVPATARARVQLEVVPADLEQDHIRLTPGQTFSVHVMLHPAGPEEGAAVDFTGQVQLAVSWDGPPGVSVQPEPAQLSVEQLGTSVYREFRLDTAAEVAELQGSLVLSRLDARGKQDLVRLKVLVGPPPQDAAKLRKLLAESHVQPELAPERVAFTAILRVEATEKKLRLHGFHAQADELHEELVDPGKSLVDFGEGDQNTKKILSEVRRLSRNLPGRLHDWVLKVAAQGPDAVLIIHDHGETRVPWELVEVEDKPLGAQFRVVRWLTAMHKSKPVVLETRREDWAGHVASYVDQEDLTETRKEFEALKSCAHSHCKDLKAFERVLKQPSQQLALVFVASHGIIAKADEHAGAIGSLESRRRQLTSLDLEALKSVAGKRPLAFINACHSARLWNGTYGPTGLPEVFVAKFSGAYLGTLGEVDDEEAARIGEHILRSARTAEGVCIPALLHALRKEAFEQFEKNDDGPSRSTYINTFLYVFYGSPESWLRLSAATGGTGD